MEEELNVKPIVVRVKRQRDQEPSQSLVIIAKGDEVFRFSGKYLHFSYFLHRNGRTSEFILEILKIFLPRTCLD